MTERHALNNVAGATQRWFVCFGPLWPAIAGATLRHQQVIDALDADTAILFVTRDEPAPAAREWAARQERPVWWIQSPDSGRLGAAKCAGSALVRREPYLVSVMRRTRRTADIPHGASIITAQGVACGFIAPDELPDSILMLCDFDPEYARNQTSVERNRIRRLLRRANDLATERYFASAYARAGRVVTLTEQDARSVSALAPTATVTTVAMALDERPPPYEPSPAPSRLVFVGGGPRNVESIILSIRSVLPRLHAQGMTLPFELIGQLSESERTEIQRAVSTSGLPSDAVSFHGRVEQIDELLNSSSILLAPFTLGAGVKVKCLDAMLRSALVATNHAGARGTPLIDDVTGFVDDDANALADKIASYGFADRGRELADAGREAALAAHTFDSVRPVMRRALTTPRLDA